ncbi:Axl1p LALA0_S01e14576g [Lachancea lanzarotensis]|uniref:LALA0S01e14576g1_1 n=1 Tax=Lachancea lanzarotensis TaxID=1245769 RepID=A0A0C7MTF5_9SACH|nr:uncharacterized protein LALA0_S01e14576g [Lachancea lanzarotensis]CEP60596.1 LALA0S01e14576g1_1 [Lachancea lanzarotensis]
MVTNFEVPFYAPISCSDRSTKICQLENGLMALLISGPTDTLASCSLTVATGSHNDPPEIPGLAHLCEHVLVASGSKKYPNGNHYHELIAHNGGSHNAYTTGENTTFYFELPAINDRDELIFEKALDAFASSFNSPIFTDAVINREIYAIESEHNVNKASINKEMYHAIRLLANTKHPFSRFCTGNFETLTSAPLLHRKPVKNSLATLFKTSYRPSNMTICIRSSHSLNALTKLLITYFGSDGVGGEPVVSQLRPNLRTVSSSRSRISQSKSPLSSSKIAKKEWAPKYGDLNIFTSDTNVIVINSTRSPIIRLVFPVCHKSTRLSTAAVMHLSRAWCDIFGEESVGSFAHRLRLQDFITSATSSLSEFATDEDGLTLELGLTQLGWKSIPTVLEILFEEYIPQFIHDRTESLAKYLSDLNAIDLLKFLYQGTEVSPMELCAEYSTRMLLDMEALKPECLLKGSPILDCNRVGSPIEEFAGSTESKTWWTGQAIMFQNFISDFVNRQNVRLVMLGDYSSSTFVKSIYSLTQTDVYFEFDYFKTSIDMFEIPSHGEPLPGYFYDAPRYGAFLPSAGKSLNLIKKALAASSTRAQEASLSLVAGRDLIQSAPRLVKKSLTCEMWVKEEELDLSFRSKTMVSFEIISKEIGGSPSNTMHLEVLGQLMAASLSAELYPAEKIGYTYEVFASNKGDVRLGFTVTGFPEGVFTLITLIIRRLADLAKVEERITQPAFRKARVAVRTQYEDAISENCAALATLGLLIMLEECMWSVEDRVEALEEIDIVSFRTFCNEFLSKSIYLNLFIQGDLVSADSIYDFLESELKRNPPTETGSFVKEPVARPLIPGTNYYIKHRGSSEDPNNSIVYFIQTGDREDIRISTLTSLTEYIFSVTLVPDMRIKKQIGYAIFGGLRLLSTTVGIHITCMSVSPSQYLEAQIDEYLSYMELQLLETMTEEDFRKVYVDKFEMMCKRNTVNKLQSTAGPADVMGQIEANVRSGNVSEQGSSMRMHKRIRQQISTRRYNFDMDSEPIDATMLRTLTLKQYTSFFREKISIYSSTRSKLSIMVESPMCAQQISQKRLYLQVEGYLKVKGLRIPKSELERIVEASQGNQQRLLKDLLKHFISNGETLKVCNLALKEVFKTLVSSMRSKSSVGELNSLNGMNGKVIAAVPLVQITDFNEFRRSLLTDTK